jgi:hypothetical protein
MCVSLGQIFVCIVLVCGYLITQLLLDMVVVCNKGDKPGDDMRDHIEVKHEQLI